MKLEHNRGLGDLKTLEWIISSRKIISLNQFLSVFLRSPQSLYGGLKA